MNEYDNYYNDIYLEILEEYGDSVFSDPEFAKELKKNK